MKQDCQNNESLLDGIKYKLRNLQSLINHAQEAEADGQMIVNSLRDTYKLPGSYLLDKDITINLGSIRDIFNQNDDIYIREFTITALGLKAAIAYIEGMVDKEIISQTVIHQLLSPKLGETCTDTRQLFECIHTSLTSAAVKIETKMEAIVKSMLSGDTALFVDNNAAAVIIATRKFELRAISEPMNESTVRGPRDSFTENLQVNITLLRRRLVNPNFIVKKMAIGMRCEVDVALVYFRGITNPSLVYQAEQRLKGLKVDMVSSSGMVENLINDHPFSPFPTIYATERPDKIVAGMMAGKIAILVDGTPFVLLAPATLIDYMQAGDDYYENWLVGSLLRLTRCLAAVFAMTTPALYVAVTTFHPALIPIPLMLTIATARIGIPFPAFLEGLLMEVLLEILQEAGVRLPKTIGPAISIVGGLVLGDSAVRAGLVSAPMVVIISFTAIVSFALGSYRISMPLRLFRVALMIAGAALGMFGVIMGVIAIIIHLSTLECFGEPYLAPLTPKNSARLSDLKDTVIVAPPLAMKSRPAYLEQVDSEKLEDK
ncbi:Spore germination protein B1 [Sporomusa rhizae]|uniref:spore germination protein n=1 Tax=Sporomusa rhizae TaxID=357999 RepID=UPI00352A8884